eukprot:571767-Rhodomonas_salina.2
MSCRVVASAVLCCAVRPCHTTSYHAACTLYGKQSEVEGRGSDRAAPQHDAMQPSELLAKLSGLTRQAGHDQALGLDARHARHRRRNPDLSLPDRTRDRLGVVGGVHEARVTGVAVDARRLHACGAGTRLLVLGSDSTQRNRDQPRVRPGRRARQDRAHRIDERDRELERLLPWHVRELRRAGRAPRDVRGRVLLDDQVARCRCEVRGGRAEVGGRRVGQEPDLGLLEGGAMHRERDRLLEREPAGVPDLPAVDVHRATCPKPRLTQSSASR